MSNHKNSVQHVAQLDGVRALAVLLVFFHHYIARPRHDELPFELGEVHWGFAGVLLFFILSGFLITLILLQGRRMIEGVKGGLPFILKQFYMRRFLRIMPLAYLVITVAVVFNWRQSRDIAAWLYTYTVNIWMAIQGAWPRRFNHFWTLAIEEQFYLIWPFVILCSPRRRLIGIVSALIISAPLYRFAANFLGWNLLAIRHLTPAWMDSLGAGALLAILVDQGKLEAVFKWLDRYGVYVGFIAVGALEVWEAIYPHARISLIFNDVAMSLIGCWLVLGAYRGFSGAGGRLLSSKIATYLGKISYGLYVYHLFIPVLFYPTLKSWGIMSITLRALIYSSVTLALASLSWYLFESPINSLKRFFPYSLPEKPDSQQVQIPETVAEIAIEEPAALV